MRRGGAKRRRDANEQAIIVALRALGATVVQISGEGVPDLLVAYEGRWTPLEVKRPRGRLTPEQQKLRGRAWFPVVSTVQAALDEIRQVIE